ncbi:GNAT family N-acetyltransferase [Flavobacterium salilacus subsp. salilacus]|uniref:GNAT family N-acetyltransferase n=1 Tax=Flavobacterium TaxID=237 RepID=UPI001074A213|nr:MULTISPECIES: GNAT family N-acetyltransferase [Flavobacterium]KAF2519393.1 GNAT family N-acetyltransferase [Flavobacterium salilacus subsp. salilacus]MBE1614715.1 GNAT family N-acetyltransferase [Flavobacterium sp. SaA2.13]NDI98219.1 GNAT family N-acetyltransferase [Flavobacterium salilacus subsp. altitudinum]
MIKIQKYSPKEPMLIEEQENVVNFLFKSLEEYGDPKSDINKCVNYAMNKLDDRETGGMVLVATLEEKIVGAVILNDTGMGGYIPENILVYIATDANYRGQGIGKKLMREAIDSVNGDIALHVEPENPAKKLYESLGFTNKYLEMRFKQTK